MAKVTLIDGTVIECEGSSIEQIYDQIKAAKESKGDFIKCGGKYIRHDQIKIIGRQMATESEDGDGETGWPEIRITIEGVKANLRLSDE